MECFGYYTKRSENNWPELRLILHQFDLNLAIHSDNWMHKSHPRFGMRLYRFQIAKSDTSTQQSYTSFLRIWKQQLLSAFLTPQSQSHACKSFSVSFPANKNHFLIPNYFDMSRVAGIMANRTTSRVVWTLGLLLSFEWNCCSSMLSGQFIIFPYQ